MSDSSDTKKAKLIGLEVLFSAVVSTKETDAIILVIHWSFITELGYRCLGIDDEASKSQTEVPSEMLPPGWNISENPVMYALKYISPKQEVVTLRAVKTANVLFISCLNHKTNNVYSSSVAIDSHVTSKFADYYTAFQDLELLYQQVEKELLKPLNPAEKLDIKSPINSRKSVQERSAFDLEHENFTHGLLVTNRMTVPPNARFDPLGPGANELSYPNPDHLPMPEFDSPMYL